jgi:hypothetical protein
VLQRSEEDDVRFEVHAAFALGILLPLLETLRRGLQTWLVDTTTMFEDYVAGALLLIAAASVRRGVRWAPIFMVVAWAYVTGMMSSSFWYQLEETLRGVVEEPPIVLCGKLILWTICLAALVSAVRSAGEARVSAAS